MNFTLKKIVVLYAIVACTFFFPAIALGQGLNASNAGELLGQTVAPTGLSEDDPATATGKLIQRVLAGSGIVFFIIMVYAGFVWMTAKGNEDRITKARESIIAAGLGILIIVASYALTNLIVGRLQEGASGASTGPAEGSVGSGDNNEPLGCCLLQTNAIWIHRIDTQNECARRGLEMRTFEWTPNSDEVACLALQEAK